MTAKAWRGAILLWLLPALGLLLVLLWTGSAAALAGLAALALFLAVAAVLSAIQARHVTIRLTLPPAAAKNEDVSAALTVAAATRLPLGRVLCEIALKNELTGERDVLCLRAAPGQTVFSFRALHCGQVRVHVRRAVLTGLSGLCCKRVRAEAAARLTVLPDTFAPEVTLRIDPAQSDESDDAPDRRGSDLTEPNALRHNQPGDSLRQLHWKLSDKLDRPIVREGSAPVARSLLVLWDRGGAPEALDAQAEVLFSVCAALAQEGVGFTLGWTTPEGLRFADAAPETDAAFEALSLTLRDAPAVGEALAEALAANGALRFGKTVCLCAAVSPALAELTGAATTVLLCGAAADETLPTVCFSPTDYEAALRHLEL